jgi:SP family galactose:H+ symporter-like MFS transporter
MIYFVAAVAAIAGMLFGFDEGVIAGALHTLRSQFAITAWDEGLMTAAVPLGALFGALIAGYAADRYGRRKTLIAASILFIVGALVASAITAIWMLSAARLMLGVAIGIAAMVAPLYISENAPASRRGMLISIYQLAVTLGILGAYIVNFALGEAWRIMFLLGALPAFALFIGMVVLDETPRWLVAKGRNQQALAALARIRAEPPESVNVRNELADIESAYAAERSRPAARWSDLLSPVAKPALIVGIGLFLLQQLSGINAVIYFAPTVFQEAGFDTHDTQILATIGIGIINVAMTVVGMALIDRIGRRRLLALGFIGATLSLGLIAVGALTEAQWLDIVASIGLALYIASFAVSIGPLPWVMMAEIFPHHVRGLGMSAATLANWGFNFLVVFSFPAMVSGLGLGGVFTIYALACLAGVAFTFRCVPETSGVTLEQIEAHLKSGRPFNQLRPAIAPAVPDPAAVQSSLALPREDADAILAAALAFSPYRQSLTPLLDRIGPIAYDNHQVRVALHTIWVRADFANTGVLRRAHLGSQASVLNLFLEHIHYSSPAFLSSVGEGQPDGDPEHA